MMRISILISIYLLAATGCAATGSSEPEREKPVLPTPAASHSVPGSIGLRVFAADELEVDTGDTLSGSSAEEITSEWAAKSAGTGLGVAASLCNPAIGVAWILTCPGGVVVGAGIAFVGSVGSAVYGGTTALNEEEMDTARAAFNRTQQSTQLANAINRRVADALRAATHTTVIGPDPDHGNARASIETPAPTLMLALDVDHAALSTTGKVAATLWIDLQISGGLYQPPATDAIDRRIWRLNTELGSLRDLAAYGGQGLQDRLDDALDAVAVTIVDDLFMPGPPRSPEDGDSFRSDVVSIQSLAPGERDIVPGAYMLYLGERAPVEGDRSAVLDGVPEMPAKSTPSPDWYVAALSALALSHDRGEIDDDAYEENKREIIREYRSATLRQTAAGRPVRVAVLPFTSFPSNNYDAVFYDVIHELINNSPTLELVYSHYDPIFTKGRAGSKEDLWRGTITDKHLDGAAVTRSLSRLGADVAVLVSYRKRTAGWYGNEFYFSLYIVDPAGDGIRTLEGNELNCEDVIRQALERLSDRVDADQFAQRQAATVALLPPAHAYFGAAVPDNPAERSAIYDDLRAFMREEPALQLSYDYQSFAGTGALDPYDVWTGSVVRKMPDPDKMQAIGEAIKVDFLMIVWVRSMSGRTETDIYVFDVANGAMGVGSGTSDRAKELVESALAQVRAAK